MNLCFKETQGRCGWEHWASQLVTSVFCHCRGSCGSGLMGPCTCIKPGRTGPQVGPSTVLRSAPRTVSSHLSPFTPFCRKWFCHTHWTTFSHLWPLNNLCHINILAFIRLLHIFFKATHFFLKHICFKIISYTMNGTYVPFGETQATGSKQM
jgi:hypothetical protein